MSGILECPCGEAHELSAKTRVAYDNVTAGLPLAVLIQTPEGCWQVPRIYLAAHGLKPAGLPRLAERYGFEKGPV
jgi:hypothetical protein